MDDAGRDVIGRVCDLDQSSDSPLHLLRALACGLLFFLGAALLVISTLLTALNLVLTRRAWQREHPGERTPLLGFVGVVTYVMWALASLGVVVLVVFFLLPWSLDWLKTTDPQFN